MCARQGEARRGQGREGRSVGTSCRWNVNNPLSMYPFRRYTAIKKMCTQYLRWVLMEYTVRTHHTTLHHTTPHHTILLAPHNEVDGRNTITPPTPCQSYIHNCKACVQWKGISRNTINGSNIKVMVNIVMVNIWTFFSYIEKNNKNL